VGKDAPPERRSHNGSVARRRFLLRRGSALYELARSSPGKRFRDAAQALGWLRRLDRDRANTRIVSELCRELGLGDRLRLGHDEALALVARRLLREDWGLAELAMNVEINLAMHQQALGGETDFERQEGELTAEEDLIFGQLEPHDEESEIEPGLEIETEEGELEAGIEAEHEEGEVEASFEPDADEIELEASMDPDSRSPGPSPGTERNRPPAKERR
jgi:hypothetical protein